MPENITIPELITTTILDTFSLKTGLPIGLFQQEPKN